MTASIWWLRRDLRLHDNPALDAALSRGGTVIPVFVVDPALWKGSWYSSRRAAFLVENLRSLDKELHARGSALTIRHGKPAEALKKLLVESGAEKIFAEKEYSPYALKRDTKVGEQLPLELVEGSMIHPPGEVLKDDGTPYKVFTPFSRKWKQLAAPTPYDVIPAPARLPTPPDLHSDPFPETDNFDQSIFPAGEQEAQKRLSQFTDSLDAPIFSYQALRNRPDLPATSQLSPYLRLGVLSVRQAVVAAHSAIYSAKSETRRDNAEVWLNQLIWREFFGHILYHYPEAKYNSFREQYRDLQWVNDLEDFEAWKAGQTGFPIVDAGMRQLAASGWMHNRARMITASFLVKNLLIDWRWGEAWFMQNLLDGDPAVNNGSWQWVAGTGTDAAPYFRIFNPVTQSKKFDPDGVYIKQWVPELRDVPIKRLHTPWEMNPTEQEASGVILGEAYPHPMIDLKFSRERALAKYGQ